MDFPIIIGEFQNLGALDRGDYRTADFATQQTS
jgi:hypothetical protein